MDKLYETPHEKYKSMRDIYVDSCLVKYKNNDFLGKMTLNSMEVDGETKDERSLTKYSYSHIFHLAENVGTFLLNRKMEHQEKLLNMKVVGIFSKNRYEWIVVDFICVLYGLTSVPLYDTLGIENLSFCLNNSEITTLFCSEQTAQTILKLKDLGNLKNIICFDPLSPEAENQLKEKKLEVFYFSEAMKKPEEVADYRKYPIDRETILTFSYTSGTTGPPKGAMISHGNFLGFLAAFVNGDGGIWRTDDVYLSFLPLPHIFERIVITSMLYSGAFVA